MIKRREFLKLAGVGALAFPMLGKTAPAGFQSLEKAKVSGQRPNILFIMTDQQTVDALSCAGNPHVKTPHLDRLAARGVRFTKSYCTYPLCCPSRASLFASRMPHELGVYGNFDAELADKGVPTMGELFKAAGYEAAYSGKWHLQVPFPAFKGKQMPGFTVLPLAGVDPHTTEKTQVGKGLTVDPNSADAAIKFLKQPRAKPFLLVASILNPHDICEYEECAALKIMIPTDPAKLPPARPNLHAVEKLPSGWQQFAQVHAGWVERQWREYLYVYYRLVEIADAEVGRVLAALEQAGLKDSTIVVFTADHGEMMGSHQMFHKQKLYDEAAAVPLIVAPPGAKPAVDAPHLASGLDIMPTLLDYAGIAAPASLEGRSLRPLVDGKQVAWRDFVASECSTGGDARMIRTARYKYIAFARGENRELFFDMEQDPGEMKNLVAESALAAEVTRHRELLKQWLLDTKDNFGKEQPPLKGKKDKQGRGGKKKAGKNE
ncbi:MAG: sulfatase-like hydrolase/transferase [Kiritimatiellaeota bacterium]|nr:sulfatase-like hydrolase/transferase [Kiritimatiellota bacterium]